jgi:glutaredoxin
VFRRRKTVATAQFVTRSGCTMCAEAQPLVERLCRDAGVPLEIVDVDVTAGEWSDHVPVVLLDGVVHSRWWVDEKALAKALHVRV